MPGQLDIPVKVGRLEIREGQGRCVIEGCRIRGGGLVSIQHSSADVLHLPELAWEGKRIVTCGDHLLEILTAVLKLP